MTETWDAALTPARPPTPTCPPETEMPTLHLPAAHTDTDLALAVEVAAVVGSHELYVAWTHGEGPGLAPQTETLFDEERTPGTVTPFAEVVVAMVHGITALWQAIIRPPSTRVALPPGAESRRQARPATEETA
jgi:hypothetical protein